MANTRLGFRRLSGLDRSGGPPPETQRGAPLRPLTIPNAIGYARIAAHIAIFLAAFRRVEDEVGLQVALGGFEQQLLARGRERAAHRHTAPIRTVELESLDQPGVCEPLESPLRRRHRPGRIQPAMDLAAEHMAEFAEQSERREVTRAALLPQQG